MPDHRWAAAAPAVAHVFVDGLDDDVRVAGDDGHHLARVRRLRVDEIVTAADGTGAWRPYRVRAVAGAALELVATGAPLVEPDQDPRLAVAFALTKGEKPERVVAQLTELGVDRIVPVVARRSVTRWDDARRASAAARFRRVAREAAMQSHRAVVPRVEGIEPLRCLAGHPGIVVADRRGDAAPTGSPPGGEWLLVAGPEGGLETGELEALVPGARLAIGPHVLRAETAAVVGAAALVATRRAGL